MKPLIILVSVFAIALMANKVFSGNYEFALSARVAMSVMLLFTAIGHFVFTKGMTMMLPDFVLYKKEIIYLTGIIEIAAAIGLLMSNFRIVTAWLLIAFFICMLPANIYAAVKQVNYQQGTFDGNGLPYLWFRVPLQALFIVWTYLSTIKY
ncbi:hypothetical protein N6H18_03515 [Reichenbachiella agarivorans]|uniref:DoxX protein n=1 Tax=Reichenbachiella agarivorans TaxID=2979464 RepID=A0ABY6CR87_9BACT|nr:hypothetical protein [Reichenbachiella agarivorans]UXP33024.1 hypothetical protein N6H18_03515 [Reichenbachiella agarivorans]